MAAKAKTSRSGSKSKARAKKAGTSAAKGARKCSEVMTPEPVSMLETTPVTEAAQAMREHDIGDIIVLDDTRADIKGIVTDRDVVVRVIAEEQDPSVTTLGSICSEELVTLEPDDPIDKAARLMRGKAIRRIPIVENEKPVGVISIGDLALELDDRSALADISSAPPNA